MQKLLSATLKNWVLLLSYLFPGANPQDFTILLSDLIVVGDSKVVVFGVIFWSMLSIFISQVPDSFAPSSTFNIEVVTLPTILAESLRINLLLIVISPLTNPEISASTAFISPSI